jgi:Zn-dependent protease
MSDQHAPDRSGAPAIANGRKLAAGAGTAAVVALSKGKGALVLLKGLPFAKLLLSGGTMFLSMFAYAVRAGWPFAVGFVLLLLIHELGHGLAMRQAGMASGWPIFIPFFGALISMQGRPEHPRVEAQIAYAGPVAGTAASLACATLGLVLHDPFFIALSYTGFFLNLFNLIPFGFLDGGRVARVVSRKAWIVGALLLGLLFIKAPSPQLLLIAGLGVMHAIRTTNDPELEAVTDADRRTWSLRYFGLCAFLGAACLCSHAMIKGAL